MDIKYYCTSLYFNCSYLSSALNVKVLNLIEEGLVRLDGSQRGLAGEGAVGADVGVLVIAEVDLQTEERKKKSKYTAHSSSSSAQTLMK